MSECFLVFLSQQLVPVHFIYFIQDLQIFLLDLPVCPLIFDLPFCEEWVIVEVPILLNFLSNVLGGGGVVEGLAKKGDDFVKGAVFLFHFLVMTPALLGLPSEDKCGHYFEYFVLPSQILDQEVPAVNLQKPMVHLIFIN